MIYEEYESIWKTIREKEKELFELIPKRDKLFEKTQPKSSSFDKELVDGKKNVNMMEQYIIQKEYYDMRINQLNQTLDDWYLALGRKKKELQASKNLYDRIYYYRYIERLSVKKIAKLIIYSERQTRRHLDNIEKSIRCPKMSKK